jgi:hypothetical protein
MKTKEQLVAEIAPLQAALGRLRDAEERQKASWLVGKCFKYRNNYSCPKGPRDYWWYYVKCVGMGQYSPKTFTFQTDNEGRIEIKEEGWFMRTDGYVEISEREFRAAWRRVQKRIAGMNP